ncbi:MAG: hypothetical protein MJZ89_05375 [Paludibacteraceae bacterium]|nr:hypothetical protein [Paludibacteraceae bacterium]
MSKNNIKNSQPQPASPRKEMNKWLKLGLKVLVLLTVVCTTVYYTDSHEYFVGDQTNNHSQRKWRSFYRFVDKKKDVDVLCLGNSHASAGIEPYIISANENCYCFILNTPGSGSVDLYYNLLEVRKYTARKLLIIESSCIVGHGTLGKEWAKIQSIESKRGRWNQLSLIPHYLPSDEWMKAVSPTIRNHSFLLKDPERIAFNRKFVGKEKNPDRQALDLGRFSHGNTGLSDSILSLYDTKGSPYTREYHIIEDETKYYIHQIYDLCQEHHIQLLFVTVPMYYRTYEAYDELCQLEQEFFNELPEAQWLDLQKNYDQSLYTRKAFNNEFGMAQHNTYLGMLINTYFICQYIEEHYPAMLPDRSGDKRWLNDFSQDNYFLNSRQVPDKQALLASMINYYLAN